jgi:hypothetical protein
MNFIRQRMTTLRTRAQALQTHLRRWALYAEMGTTETRGELLGLLTPAESAQFEATREITRERLRPVAVHIDLMRKWFDFVFERINEQFERARTLIDQGRGHESLAILADIEWRMLGPNRDTLTYFQRMLGQRSGHLYHQKLAALDAIVRDLYLPSVKIAHQRGLLPREALSRTPLPYIVDAADGACIWRQHAQAAAAVGRPIPINLLAVPRERLDDPWNLVAIAHEVGIQLYHDLQLGYECSHKLLRESPNANVSSQTAPLWSRWHEMLFADVFATLRLGPAYVSGMIEMMGAQPGAAVAWSNDSTPPAYIRWHVMLQTLQLLGCADEARLQFGHIHTLCGDPAQVARSLGAVWMQLVNEARSVAGLIAFTPYQKLGGARVIDFAPPFLSADAQQAAKVKDILLAGDESCVRDTECRWAEGVRQVPAHLAIAGLRNAYDAIEDYETTRRLWIRFWCMMQRLTQEASPSREREDREFAPNDTALKSFAQRAVPAMA